MKNLFNHSACLIAICLLAQNTLAQSATLNPAPAQNQILQDALTKASKPTKGLTISAPSVEDILKASQQLSGPTTVHIGDKHIELKSGGVITGSGGGDTLPASGVDQEYETTIVPPVEITTSITVVDGSQSERMYFCVAKVSDDSAGNPFFEGLHFGQNQCEKINHPLRLEAGLYAVFLTQRIESPFYERIIQNNMPKWIRIAKDQNAILPVFKAKIAKIPSYEVKVSRVSSQSKNLQNDFATLMFSYSPLISNLTFELDLCKIPSVHPSLADFQHCFVTYSDLENLQAHISAVHLRGPNDELYFINAGEYKIDWLLRAKDSDMWQSVSSTAKIGIE